MRKCSGQSNRKQSKGRYNFMCELQRVNSCVEMYELTPTLKSARGKSNRVKLHIGYVTSDDQKMKRSFKNSQVTCTK